MTKSKSQKITLSASRDIPFNQLVLSQSNVRQIKAGVSIEELAEDIARRTLLASLTVVCPLKPGPPRGMGFAQFRRTGDGSQEVQAGGDRREAAAS